MTPPGATPPATPSLVAAVVADVGGTALEAGALDEGGVGLGGGTCAGGAAGLFTGGACGTPPWPGISPFCSAGGGTGATGCPGRWPADRVRNG